MNSPGEGRALSYRQARVSTYSQSRKGKAKPFGLSSVLIKKKKKKESSPLSDIQKLRDMSVLGVSQVTQMCFIHQLCDEVIGWCNFLPCPVRNDRVWHCEAPRRLGGAAELQPASSAVPLDSSSPRPVLPPIGELWNKQSKTAIRLNDRTKKEAAVLYYQKEEGQNPGRAYMQGQAAGRGLGLVPELFGSECCTRIAGRWGRRQSLCVASAWGEPLLAAVHTRPGCCSAALDRSFALEGSNSAPSVPGSGQTAGTMQSTSTVSRFQTSLILIFFFFWGLAKKQECIWRAGFSLTSFMAVRSSNTFCSLASTSSLRAWELLSSWETCSSKALKKNTNSWWCTAANSP